jgi:hypothetical protein
MRFTLLLPLIWLCTFTARAQDQPSFQYQPLEMDGWTVLIQDKLEAEPELLGPVTRLLRVKLWEISTRLPAPVVARLQEVPIRMHLDREGCPGGVYHPSEDWLRDHQFPTDWARGVEFGNARNFLSWTRSQPFMVLHELSHAWHHQVLGYDRKDILLAFEEIGNARTLEQVLYVTGGTKRAYALNNEMEFFAEMSEAWWATNDFFPFVRAEVQASFPGVPELMNACWQVPE